MRRWIKHFTAVAALAALAAPSLAQDGPVVFAAASLKNALDAVNAACAPEVGGLAVISYAASSALAKQIEQGAPADLFFSADLDWMAYLSERNLTKKDTETQLLGNRLVLVAPTDSAVNLTIGPSFDLVGALGDGRLAVADVQAVPAGKYGKAALESLGVWPTVEGRLAQAENVRAALKLVSTGEAPLGIVYATDAKAEPGVEVIATFPESSHPPIVYPVAELAESRSAATGKFLSCLRSDKAKTLFEEQGFSVLAPSAVN